MSASIRLEFIVRRTNCGGKARRRATTIAESQQQDLERTLLYTLRIASWAPCGPRRYWPGPRKTWTISKRSYPSTACVTSQILHVEIDRTPVDQFAVTGALEFQAKLMPLDEFHIEAVAARPDLKAAKQTVAVANGSTDPIYAGVEKARTEIDIFYTQRQKDAADVSSHGWLLETATRIRDSMSFAYQHGQAALPVFERRRAVE